MPTAADVHSTTELLKLPVKLLGFHLTQVQQLCLFCRRRNPNSCKNIKTKYACSYCKLICQLLEQKNSFVIRMLATVHTLSIASILYQRNITSVSTTRHQSQCISLAALFYSSVAFTDASYWCVHWCIELSTDERNKTTPWWIIPRDICFNMSGVSFCWQYFLINFNFQQRNFVTLKNLILIYLLYIDISYDCCSDNCCLTECIVAIGNSSVHRSSTPVESMDSPMNLTTVWCKSVWCIGEINRWIKQRSRTVML